MTFFSILLVCQCDDRGKQVGPRGLGDWCYLRTTPCKLLTNTTTDWTWARCVLNGVKQIECDVGKDNRQDGKRSLVFNLIILNESKSVTKRLSDIVFQVECIHDRECRPGTKCSNGCHKGCTCSFQHTCEFYCNDCLKRADLSARCGTCGSLRSSRAISADRNNYSCCDRCELIPTFSTQWRCMYCDKSSNRSFL